jgi:SAM-dependent methyltransferase
MNTAQDAVNGKLYRRPELTALYAHTSLTPSEATALVRYRDDIADRNVLDIGCGAGRLAAYLRPLTDGYVGVDTSQHMIAHCRGAFPGQVFHRADMRDMSQLEDHTFDAVFALANVLDAVSHDDRLKTLAEIHRVLAPGGLFVFSTHNRHCARLPERPHLEHSRNPLTQVRNVATYVAALTNHFFAQQLEYDERDYAIMNDSGHNFAVLHYYIARDEQTRQLAAAGFHELAALDETGATLAAGAAAAVSTSIHYIARRE